jgi:hypothetical protein
MCIQTPLSQEELQRKIDEVVQVSILVHQFRHHFHTLKANVPFHPFFSGLVTGGS